MFRPVKGPKEGRSPPGLLYAGPQHGGRGRFSNRQTTIGLVVLVFLLMGYIVLNSEGGTISSAPTTVTVSKPESGGLGKAILNDNKAAPPADANAHEVHAEIPIVQEKPKPKPTPITNPNPNLNSNLKPTHEQVPDESHMEYDFKPIKNPPSEMYQEPANSPTLDEIKKSKEEVHADDDVIVKPFNPKGWRPQENGNQASYSYRGQEKLNSAPAPAREKWSERPELEKALANAISMLPDEVMMRELTRTVEGSGKEKMREMGLRTRAYRKYFDAWEALHLTTDSEGNTVVRDDIIQYLRSRQRVTGHGEFFDEGVDGLNIASTIRQYEAYRAFIQKFAELLFPWTMPWFGDHMALHASIKKGGRGIVLTAGDDQAPYLLTTIYSFRQLGCTLPIEVMYLGDQDLGEDYRAELEALPGVVTRDISQMTKDQGWKLAGWAAKPFAMLLSSFREALFIDADSLFFKNPEILFDEPDYQKTGALFFKDRLIMPEKKKRWLQQVLPKPIPKAAKESRFWTGESGHMQESGVVLIDKWKHFVSLLLITRFNGPDRDGNKEKGITGVYEMMYGDKETFWVGFLLAGDEYSFHRGDAGVMGELDERFKKKAHVKRGVIPPEKDEKTTALSSTSSAKPATSSQAATPKSEATSKSEALSKPQATPKSNTSSKSEVTPKTQATQKTEVTSKTEATTKAEITSKSVATNAVTTTTTVPHALVEELEEHEISNYTLCAPQLLHLDLEGRPLWFNGWLLKNKYADKTKKIFANFESYLIEPREPREPGAWQLGKSNMCCLTTDPDKKHDFSPKEKEVLAMIMARAHEVGMGNQH